MVLRVGQFFHLVEDENYRVKKNITIFGINKPKLSYDKESM